MRHNCSRLTTLCRQKFLGSAYERDSIPRRAPPAVLAAQADDFLFAYLARPCQPLIRQILVLRRIYVLNRVIVLAFKDSDNTAIDKRGGKYGAYNS